MSRDRYREAMDTVTGVLRGAGVPAAFRDIGRGVFQAQTKWSRLPTREEKEEEEEGQAV